VGWVAINQLIKQNIIKLAKTTSFSSKWFKNSEFLPKKMPFSSPSKLVHWFTKFKIRTSFIL